MPVKNSPSEKKKNMRKERRSRGYSAGLMKHQICQMITGKAMTTAVTMATLSFVVSASLTAV